MNIYLFYTRERRFRQLMLATGLNRNRYVRLMAVSAAEILGTIPLGTLFMVKNAKLGVNPWRGWAYTHEHYSVVYQVPASIWKNEATTGDVFALEMFRWSLVLCAFIFFALFGFADEARRHYRSVYASIVSRIGYPRSLLHRPSHARVVHSIYRSATSMAAPLFSITLPARYVKNNGATAVTVVEAGIEKQDSSFSLTQESSILSIGIDATTIRKHSILGSSSFFAVEHRDFLTLGKAFIHVSPSRKIQTPMPGVVILPSTAPLATVPSSFP